MGWQNKQTVCVGSVFFPGSLPPRAADFEYLARLGVEIRPMRPPDHLQWELELNHRLWGQARLLCVRDEPPPPHFLLDWDPRLTDQERAEARRGRCSVVVSVQGVRGNVLRDRKNLFRYLRAIMGDDAVVSLDVTASRFWSRAALDDELCHDADLDVESLYVMHVVGPEGREGRPQWAHSHGLAELGFFDFDVLQPTEQLGSGAADAFRAVAFSIVEGRAQRSTPLLSVASNGGDVRMVDVCEFNHRAAPEAVALRDSDDFHNRNRSILCEPQRGLFARWFGRVQPSRFFSQPIDDSTVFFFSNEASALMAERARLTWAKGWQYARELEEFRCPCLAKLSYRTDGGAETDYEHLWFRVHDCRNDRLDATLINDPIYIARMSNGQRGWHDLELLSDWTIITPVGWINPRNIVPLRIIRANADELRRLVKEAGQEHSNA